LFFAVCVDCAGQIATCQTDRQHVHQPAANTHFNPLNAELNSICHLLALLGTHPILHISRIKVKVQLCTAMSSVKLTLHRVLLSTNTECHFRPQFSRACKPSAEGAS